MAPMTQSDTVRILVATDSHVGYMERDAVRGDDSWQSFHEVMHLAKDRDVDMVLLAGDLFHDNKPSRKSMYQVMRSLRMNCFGEKPCELEMLSDGTETFAGAFPHVNYEDPDINVAIPVFSIHGNHDDPSGEGHLAALDLLEMSGLVNYYGRTPESDNILVKPVLLQKGNTKLALYGMSNVRDERLFRTFRDGQVKFFQPSAQKEDWFNLMSVHQNHHAYTETGYLPENFLPSFLDLVVWGHEHECKIDPRYNPEMSFHVMQPGSSVATSLALGEAVPKHVAILSVKGKDFECETIRLKTVRPFVMREIVLQDDKHMREVAMQVDSKPKITRYLEGIVRELIEEAKQQWRAAQEEDGDSAVDEEPPKPLVRLRVEYTSPEGGRFDCENPQRFSQRFSEFVANRDDVVQFHKKKIGVSRKKTEATMPEESVMAQMSLDNIKVEKLVREFLTAQSLTILPQNSFGDAVSQYVDKDDKHAMEMFVEDSLTTQQAHLLGKDKRKGGEDEEEDGSDDDDAMAERMEAMKAKLEEAWASGRIKRSKKKGSYKPRPVDWDSDFGGHWEDQPAALIISDNEGGDHDDEEDAAPVKKTAASGRGKAAVTTRKTTAGKKAPAKAAGRGKKKPIESDSEEEEEQRNDVIMIDDDDDDEDAMFVKPAAKPAARKTPANVSPKTTMRSTSAAVKKAPTKSAGASRQSQLDLNSFGYSQSQAPNAIRRPAAKKAPPPRMHEASEDEISDDDDAFEPPPPTARSTRKR